MPRPGRQETGYSAPGAEKYIAESEVNMKNNNFVKSLRERLKLTQQDLAQQLGVSLATISRWEHGHNRPSKLARRQLERLERKG